jgi:hypothetical protein
MLLVMHDHRGRQHQIPLSLWKSGPKATGRGMGKRVKPQGRGGKHAKATAAAAYALDYISTLQKEARHIQNLGVHLVSLCNNLGYVAVSYAVMNYTWVGESPQEKRREGERRRSARG